MVLPEASLGEATRSVPKGSPLGSSRVPTHNTDVRIVLALAFFRRGQGQESGNLVMISSLLNNESEVMEIMLRRISNQVTE